MSKLARVHWRGQHEFGIRLDMSKPDNVSFLSSKLHATLEYAVGFERRPSALEWARTVVRAACKPAACSSNARKSMSFEQMSG